MGLIKMGVGIGLCFGGGGRFNLVNFLMVCSKRIIVCCLIGDFFLVGLWY